MEKIGENEKDGRRDRANVKSRGDERKETKAEESRIDQRREENRKLEGIIGDRR